MPANGVRSNAVQMTDVHLAATAPGSRTGDMVQPAAEFDVFFRAEFQRVVRTVSLIVGDRGRAEEIAQDAFVRLLDHWVKVSRYEQPGAWVRRVAIRMAGRAAARDRKRRTLEGSSQPMGTVSGIGETDTDVVAAVKLLPPGQRAAIVLFYFEDRPVSEIASLLECSPATARVQLHKARRRLATILGEGAHGVA